MSIVSVGIIFALGWLVGIVTFLSGSLWRGGVAAAVQNKIFRELAHPGTAAKPRGRPPSAAKVAGN